MLQPIKGETLYDWQWSLLFIAVLLFPVQSLLLYKNSFLSYFCFYGQISSIPVTLGIVLALIATWKEGIKEAYFLSSVVRLSFFTRFRKTSQLVFTRLKFWHNAE